MGQLTQTTAQVQVILDDADAANVGKTSLTDGSDTTSVAFKKSGFYSLQGSSANAPSTDRAVLISAVRDTAATGEIRYGQIAITESNGLWWNRDDGGSLGTWYEAVTTASAQTLTNKTLTSPILTTPQINDSAADHQYIFAGSDLTADRTVTLPLLTGDDTFVFAAHTQTLTNKTLTTPTVSGLTLSDASVIFEGATANDYETTLTVTDPTADRTITLPDATDTLVGRATTDTLTNKTLTSPIASGLSLSDASIVFEGATANDHETTLTVTDPTADRTITLPDATDTLVGLATTDTLTNKTLTSPVFNTGVSGTAVLDEDDFTGASATKLATSESIKAYVDAQVGSFDTLSEVLAAGNTTGSTNIEVENAQKVQFRDTAIYINSSADGQLDIVSDTTVQIDSGGTITLDADTDGQVAFKDGGTQYGLISKAVNNLILKSSVVDGDVIIQGTDSGGTVTAATFDMSNSGAATFGGAVTADAGISVDNININGTTIALSSGDLTIDVAGDIILDADGGDFKFRDGGAGFFTISNSSLDTVLKTEQSNEDFIIKGNDGGSEITALTLDMSEAGAATFNAGATFGGTVTTDGITNNGDVVFSKSTTGVPIIKMSGFATAGNPYGIINFYNEDGSQQGPNNAVQIKALAKNTDGSGGELAFHTSTGTGSEGADAVERLRIGSSGQVTIKAAGADASRTLSIQGTNGSSQTYQFNIVADGENSAAKFMIGSGGGAASERLRIDSVGTTTIKTDGTTQLVLNRADASIQSGNQIANLLVTGDDPSAGQSGASIAFTAGDAWATNSYPTNIVFYNDNSGTLSPRMTLTSDGNLLVGKTSTALATAGLTFGGAGFASLTRDGAEPLNINRLSSDGNLAVFYKAGTSVGSIGVTSGSLGIGQSNTGLGFFNTDSIVFPATAAGSTRDSAIDLGYASGGRFKNLYLSGGVYANNASGAFLWNAENSHIAFGTNNIERLRIASNGWVNPNANTTSNPADSQGLHFGWNLSNGGGESLIVFNQGAGATGGLVFSDNSANGTPVERMRIGSDGVAHFNGDVKVLSGDIQMGSGRGINFSASSNAGGMTSETLDDYEEGLWTLTIATSGTGESVSIGSTTGTYTKIGRQVTATIYTSGVNVSAAGSGAVLLGGLPFTCSNGIQFYAVPSFGHTTLFSYEPDGYVTINQTYITVTRVGTTTSNALSVGNPRYMMMTVTYFTDS